MTIEERKLIDTIEAIAKCVKKTFWLRDGTFIHPNPAKMKRALYDIKCLCEKEVDFESIEIN